MWYMGVIVLELENVYISFSNTIVACFVRGGSGHDIFMIMCKTHTHPSVRADDFFSLKEMQLKLTSIIDGYLNFSPKGK